MLDLGSTERGCLLFADITGYTKYIGQTEITHAQDVIADLIETIVGTITPVFKLSRVEGDAAFGYAEVGTLSPALLMDTVDSTYFSFRRRLRDIAHATSCQCQACIRIPALDLKFFLHEGEYAVRKVAGFDELSGLDVIVLHRLAKGSAAEVVDGHAYAVYTKPIVDVMAWDPASLDLVPLQEEFEDTGPIDVFVQDLEVRWQSEEERARFVVSPERAIYHSTFDTSAPPQLVWSYLTDPAKRPEWQAAVTEVIPTTGGRPGPGTVNHCMHGADMTIEHIEDWRPFSHVTVRYDTAGVEGWAWTYRVEQLDEGTRVSVSLDQLPAEDWERVGDAIIEMVDEGGVNLKRVIEEAHAGR